MNRARLWLFVLLVLGMEAADLYFMSRRLATRELEEADRRLRAGVAGLEARSRLLARQVGDLAEAAARDPALSDALSPRAPPEKPGKRPKPRPQPLPAPSAAEVHAAGEAAVRQAERLTGVELPRGSAVGIGRGETLAFRSGGKPVGSDKDRAACAWLAAARVGSARHGYVRLDGAVYFAAAVPAPGGAALAVAQPLESGWLAGAKAAGPDVTVPADPKEPLTTLSPGEARRLLAVPMAPGRAVDVGKLGRVEAADGLPLPPLPILFVSAPAYRAQAVPLEGLPGVPVILSEAIRPRLTTLAAWQQMALLSGAFLLLVGLVLGLFMTSARRAAQLPKELVTAADLIARGQFDARAPMMAGALGTVAEALNVAAEAAQGGAGAGAPSEAFSAPLPGADLPAARGESGEATAPEFAPPPAPPARPAAVQPSTSDTSRLDGSELFGAPRPQAPAAPRAAPAAAPAPAARAAPPAAASADEAHFRQIFDEFVRVRRECGEPVEGLTYEKFLSKLQRNRDSLVQKYACRTVRFEVYVKDGKAALKATPVR